jgi:protein-tyrosine phosphatase
MSENEISEIIPDQLFLSSLHYRYQEDLLLELGITVICDLSNRSDLPQYENNGISYFLYSIQDSENENIEQIMKEIYEHFENKGEGKMLLHCVHGISRSAACALYCLMKFSNQTLKKSFQQIKVIRPVVLPNIGFMNQLITAEQEIFGRTTLVMGKYGQFLWQET